MVSIIFPNCTMNEALFFYSVEPSSTCLVRDISKCFILEHCLLTKHLVQSLIWRFNWVERWGLIKLQWLNKMLWCSLALTICFRGKAVHKLCHRLAFWLVLWRAWHGCSLPGETAEITIGLTKFMFIFHISNSIGCLRSFARTWKIWSNHIVETSKFLNFTQISLIFWYTIHNLKQGWRLQSLFHWKEFLTLKH